MFEPLEIYNLLEPVSLNPAYGPMKTLFEPVTMLAPAELPMATLRLPVVF